MLLELTDEETFALLNLLVDAIEGDRYPMSPRIRLLRGIAFAAIAIVHSADEMITQWSTWGIPHCAATK